MKPRSKLVWKLTAVAAAILIAAIVLSGYVHALVPVLLGILALRFMFGLLLEKPIGDLIAGTRRIADHHLDFRFDRRHKDEIGELQDSFNSMTATIQASQDELRDAKEYLEGIIENSADVIIAVNSEGLIEMFNRGGEEVLGYERSSVIGRPIESLYLDPRDRRTVVQRLEETGNVKNFATRLLAKDGRVRNVLLTLSHLRDSEGNPIGTIGISKDVTQEKKLQDELRDAKEYLEGIIENSADMIITTNNDGLIKTFNSGGEELLGYRRAEVIGRPIESLYCRPSERRAVAAMLEETGNVKNFATRLVAKDGRVRNVLVTLSQLRDGQGRPIGTIGISKDVTQEKKLQDELRDAKEYLEGMVENSADIIITVNKEGLIETFNSGGEEALGYGRAEVIGKPIESLFVDPRERHTAAEILDRTGNVTNYETRLLTKDGQVQEVLLTLSRLRDAEGRPIGTIGISKNITEQKRLQRELIQSQKFAAIGQATTGIQHAIKNMLNALTGGAYLIRVGIDKDNRQQVSEGREMVQEGIERISNLSRNMLNFAREWKPDLQDVDLNDLIISIGELNRPTAADRGVAIRYEVSEGLPPVICDPKLIHMAATDLVVNAIDACTAKHYPDGEEPEILLSSSLSDSTDHLVIEVRDNGCGMTDNVRQNIFNPFFSTKKTLGTGLGLAVTARIIRLHEGEIRVESAPDRGTTFRIDIPREGPKHT